MTVKIQMANGGADSVDFVNAAGTTLAQVKGYDDGTSNGHLEFYTNTSGTVSEKVRVQNGLHIQQDSSSNNRIVFRGQPASSYRWNIDNYGSSNQLRFFRENDADASSGSVMMTLDNAGNVGIGTSSPNIYSTGSSTNVLGVQASGTNQNGLIAVAATGTGFGGIEFGNTTIRRSGIYALDGSSLGFYTNSSNSGTALTERARIDSSGNLLVGTASSNDKVTVANSSAACSISVGNGTNYTRLGRAQNNGEYQNNLLAGDAVLIGQNGVSVAGGNGGATQGVRLASNATSWSSLSDIRTKDIIEPIENATEKIANWRTVVGKYKTDNDGVRRSFLIAQDVLETFPEAVDTSDENSLGLRYQETIPVLVKAIQELAKTSVEQQALIQQLTARIETLEAK